MDPANDHERSQWCAYLGEPFTDRLVICGLGPLAAFTDTVSMLKTVGAAKPLLVATGRGAGECAAEDDAERVLIDGGAFESMTEELRDQDRLARHLPEAAHAAIEGYDPDGDAVWLMGPFVVNEPILERRVLGGRPASWLALEDKLLADEIWDEAGHPRAVSRSVPVDEAGSAAAALDRGAGVVWAGDARDGFNGGGDFTRWVVTKTNQRAALEFFAQRCDRVRAMPFLDGVPCSIHGIVLPDGTATFRPVELAVLRTPDHRFVYGGQGTTWDPPPDDREQMRELVRRTGEALRRRVRYRGAFGIDGIMTADGFRPTELNTRMAGGLATLARAVDATSFTLLQLACIADRDPQVTVAELEECALPLMDVRRTCKPIAITARHLVGEPLETPVSWDGGRLERAEGPDFRVLLAPSAVGSYSKLVPRHAVQPGTRMAPLNVALMEFLDEEFDAGFGAVEAPPEVR